MSRGDQRERDRTKNLKKMQDKAKQQANKGSSVLQRNTEDAAKLQAKVAAKKAQLEAAVDTEPTKAPIVRKKVPKKKEDTLDDLLSSGLSATKKRGK